MQILKISGAVNLSSLLESLTVNQVELTAKSRCTRTLLITIVSSVLLTLYQ